YNLGVMYANGRGVPKDEREAVAWYRKAAEQGDAAAQYNLGWMYDHGQGVAKDEREAVAWYRKAAEQGDEDAKTRLNRLNAKTKQD
ncbi:MAG: tetratricopeptide repeat protein, partial [Methylobacter sp.]